MQHLHVKRTGYTFSLKNIELALLSLNEALCFNTTKVEKNNFMAKDTVTFLHQFQLLLD